MNQVAVTGIVLFFGLVIGTGLTLYEYFNREQPHHYGTNSGQTDNNMFNSCLTESNKIRKRKQKKSKYQTCSICLENFVDGSKLVILSCQHYFHGKCITQWLKQNDNKSSCPLCRSKHSSVNLITYSSNQVIE